jgi:type IV secretory pathway VirB10-like protein
MAPDINNPSPVGDDAPPVTVPRRRHSSGGGKDKLLLVGGGVVIAVVVFMFLSSQHQKKPMALMGQQTPPSGTTKKTVKRSNANAIRPSAAITPSDQAAQQQQTQTNTGSISSDVVSSTATPIKPGNGTSEGSANLTGSSGRGREYASLNKIPKFPGPNQSSNGQWAPPKYGSEGSAERTGESGETPQQVQRELEQEVTAPSLVFTSAASTSVTPAGHNHSSSSSHDQEVSNFGLEPGYHISARIEAVVSTALMTPVVAVVQYNYERDGKIVIPAGARVIGSIANASANGMMNIKFSSMYMPNGKIVPIDAVATSQTLGPIKGFVTGRDRALKFLIGTLAGIGGAASLYGAASNSTSPITPTEELQTQLAANAGNSANNQIQQMNVQQRVVVTVPAGTPIFVTFTSAVKSSRLNNSAISLPGSGQ